MLKWIFEHFAVVIVLVVFASQILRALLQAKKTRGEQTAKRDVSAEERRMREVQEQIRRQIAERRSGRAPVPEPPPLAPEPASRPVPRPTTTQMPEPFGGPLGRMLEELQRKVQPAAPPPLVVSHRRAVAEVERQERIVEELRVAEETRVIAKRRADHIVADRKAEADSESGQRTAARARLLTELRDPQSLRRAFVLREVLGAPVGLR
jgi:hypothetical protein